MHLERHVWRLEFRIDSLANKLRIYNDVVISDSDIYIIDRIIIQLQIEWEHFVRSLILDSATGNFRSRSGPVRSNLTPKVKNRKHAKLLLLAQYPRRNKEPDWYLPHDAIVAAQKLLLSNHNKIALELGVSPWELNELRYIRNFISHSSGRSAIEVRNSGCVKNSDRIIPSKICYDYITGGVRRYDGWINFMKTIASRLVD